MDYEKYYAEIATAFAERTITRLWITITVETVVILCMVAVLLKVL